MPAKCGAYAARICRGSRPVSPLDDMRFDRLELLNARMVQTPADSYASHHLPMERLQRKMIGPFAGLLSDSCRSELLPTMLKAKPSDHMKDRTYGPCSCILSFGNSLAPLNNSSWPILNAKGLAPR